MLITGLNFQNVNENPSILKNSNGRVIIDTPNIMENKAMFEKINIKNKAVDLRDQVIDNSNISKHFFSESNVKIIQEKLKKGVYELSKGHFNIPNQNIEKLFAIMRSVYNKYNSFSDDTQKEINSLNSILLNTIVPEVYNSAISYEIYIRDVSTIATPINFPLQLDRNFKQIEFKKWF
jgi:hypothetical protein